MKKRFSEEQIIGFLQEACSANVSWICTPSPPQYQSKMRVFDVLTSRPPEASINRTNADLSQVRSTWSPEGTSS